MVYSIIWEIHLFSHQFPIAWEKAGESIEWEKPVKFVRGKILQNPSYVENLRNWFSYFSIVCCFFPIGCPSYGIFHHMGNVWIFSSVFHSMRKGSKTHPMRKTWGIGYHTFSIVLTLWYTL